MPRKPRPRKNTPAPQPRPGFGRRLTTALKAPFTPGPAADAEPGHVGWRGGVVTWAGAIATGHIAVTLLAQYPTSIITWAYPLATLAMGLLVLTLVPGQWRRWYRWVGLWMLSLVVFPAWFFVVMSIGEGWALYRAWTETTPADFRRRYHRAGTWARNTLPARKPRPATN